MQKPITTKTHGVLDYITVPTLLALPRVMGWSAKMTNLLTGAGIGLLGYSIMTRYELGFLKVLPMAVHLGLDATSGAMLAAAPFVFADEKERDGTMTGILLGLGAFELSAALLTQTRSLSSKIMVKNVVLDKFDQFRSRGATATPAI